MGGELQTRINEEQIRVRIKANFETTTRPYLTARENLVVGIKITGLGMKTMEYVTKLLQDRNQVSGIAISAVTPGAHNIDRVLETWVRARVLTKYDVTKAGYYVIMVNDGDQRLIGGNWERDSAEYKAYLTSCTRINITNPKALARCNLPSISNLRKIARRTHFVASTGEVIKFPGNYRWASRSVVEPHISKTMGMDDVKQDADSSLRAFLKQSGIHTERGGEGGN